MTVGPKGQVVIPRAMRKVLKIQPGSKVVFRLEDGRAVVQKQEFDSVGTLEGVAHRGRSIRRIQPHQYETELAGGAEPGDLHRCEWLCFRGPEHREREGSGTVAPHRRPE